MSNADSPALPAPGALAPDFALGLAAMVAAALALSVSPSLVRLAFAGDLLLRHLSVTRTTIADATFFATCAPIWVVFGWLLFGQRIPRPVPGGLALPILGGAALVVQSFAFDPAHAVGDALGIATGVFFGLHLLAIGAARLRAGAVRVTFGTSVVAGMVPFAAAAVIEPHLLPRSGGGWAVLLALALVSHAGGRGLPSVALGRLPTAFSSLVTFVEAVTPVQAVGGAVVLPAIFVARPRAAADASAPRSAP